MSDAYTARCPLLVTLTLDPRMSWLDIYLVVLFLALVGLLVAKFRG